MKEEDYGKKRLIKNLLDNPLFGQVIDEIRLELGLIMLDSEEESKRAEIYSLGKALDRLVGHLTAIANEVRDVESKDG